MKTFKNKIFLITSIQFFLFIILLISTFLYTYTSKSNEAKFISKNLHNPILIHDYRLTEQLTSINTPTNFIKIKIYSNTSNLIFETGFEPNEALTNFNKIEEPLYFSSNNKSFQYLVVFYFSIKNVITSAILLFIFQLSLTIPLYFSIEKYLLKEKFKKIEYEKNNELKKAALQLSHDIRSPLATLNSISENLTSSSSEDMKLLKLSINRINQISNSLLSQGKEDVSRINLTETISNLIELKKIEHPNSKINLVFEKFTNYYLTGNKTELERMISNLINNSIEASSKPEILICIEKLENKLSFSIKDNGSGIPVEIIANLGKKNITTKENGNGLGLSHAYQTAKEMKAEFKIDVNSHGTKIEFLFDQFEQMEQKSTISVLLDDDELTRMNWEYKAKKANKELLIFKNKDELYSQLHNLDKSTTFYIDSELGNIKGEEIAKDLNQKGFTTIYMASGHSSDHFQELTFLKGVIDKNPPF